MNEPINLLQIPHEPQSVAIHNPTYTQVSIRTETFLRDTYTEGYFRSSGKRSSLVKNKRLISCNQYVHFRYGSGIKE